MIEDAINDYPAFEDAPVKKPFKRRIAVTALLALAAMGAHHFHGRTITPLEPESVASKAVNSDEIAKNVVGPNSLFGDVCTDQKLSPQTSTELSFNELEMTSSIDQLGLAATVAPSLERVDSGSLNLQSVDTADARAQSNLSAVPEPSAAGIALLALAPVMSLRRPRNRRHGA
jgi:hypothetical protein